MLKFRVGPRKADAGFPRAWKEAAFSLIELLVVMAIVAILATVSLTAFTQIGQSGALTKTGSDIAGMLEQARAYAVAHNASVWVGFSTGDDDALLVGVMTSRNGDSQPATNEQVSLSRVRRFDRVKLVVLADADGRPAASDGAQLANLSSAIFPFSLGKTSFTNRVVQFNSRGESRILPNQTFKVTEVGLQQYSDGQIRNPQNHVAIQVGGLSGAVSLYRP